MPKPWTTGIALPHHDTPSLPATMRHALIKAGLADPQSVFHPLNGGRTNRLWRFHSVGQDLVCKLFSGAETPLFPNSSTAEGAALRALADTGLAPEMVGRLRVEDTDALVYRHVAGQVWAGSVSPVAQLLRRLHDQPAPAFRQTAQHAEGILRQGDAMLAGLTDPRAARLQSLRPSAPDLTLDHVFLHGDPVPSNIVQSDSALCLIDWQCPAIGDPTEDLSLFLSPAMQHLFGGRVLTAQEEGDFLTAYAHPARAVRYRKLAPLYHWRMAAYCLWKIAQPDPDYARGYALELARL